MRKLINIFLIFFISGIFASCRDDIFSDMSDGGSLEDGIEISLSFPEMTDVSTRGFGDTPTTPIQDMDLYLFVFDGSRLYQTIHIGAEETRLEDGVLKFTAFLPQTDEDATVHIVATDDRDGSFAAQIEENGYGIEDSVMPALESRDNKDTYWQRVDIGCPIIVTVKNEGNELANVQGTETTVRAKFANPIPLIRNFAKISIENHAPGFNILGWTVVNDRDRGSVVPWYSEPGNADIKYAEYYDQTAARVKTYNELNTSGYEGVSQPGALFKNTVDKISDNPTAWNTNGTTPIYLYERKISSVNPLYVIVCGSLSGGTPSYYKLALGHTDHTTGFFTEYNVIRNIEYHIDITAVSTQGSKTPEAAANGPAFNNISGDVTTRNLTQISDGIDKLQVSFINYVVTESNQKIDFKFKFDTGLTTSAKKTDNDLVEFKDLATGDVIKSLTIEPNDDADGWRTVHLEFNDPTDDLKQQKFVVYVTPANSGVGNIGGTPMQGLGLSRTINLVLRNPWEFVRMETFPGQWDNDSKWPDYDPDDTPSEPDINYYVGGQKGAPLTIFFELPAGLPEAVFPLTFIFESDKQNIENMSAGSAVVRFGKSLFPNVLDNRISYEKTLTWEEYAVNDGNSTPQSRIQRARFITTTNISNLTTESISTRVRLENKYFHYEEDTFLRDLNVAVDGIEPNVWDFSSEEWRDVVNSISGGSSNGFSATVRGFNISNNGNNGDARALKSGGNATTGYYIQMTRTTHTMRFSYTYGKDENSAARQGILRITAQNGGLTVTQTGGVSITPASNTFAATKGSKDWTVNVSDQATTVWFEIKPSNNNAVNIYKVEFLPFGD